MRFFSLLLMAVMVMARFGSSTALDGQLMGILSSNTHPRRDVEQEIVTFDKDSLFIHGKRVMIFSAEIHPFRFVVNHPRSISALSCLFHCLCDGADV